MDFEQFLNLNEQNPKATVYKREMWRERERTCNGKGAEILVEKSGVELVTREK